MDNGFDQLPLLGRGCATRHFDDGSSGQVNLNASLDTAREIAAIEIHGNESGRHLKFASSEFSTPLIERRCRIAFQFTELSDGQFGAIKSTESIAPLLGELRVG